MATSSSHSNPSYPEHSPKSAHSNEADRPGSSFQQKRPMERQGTSNILVETNRTFITQTNNMGANKGIYASSDDNVMAEPYRLHGKINEWIDSFDRGVANLLRDHEADFLNAYKEQMFLIQMELRELKGQIDAEHIKEKTNKRINRLEEERNLFRAQALDLDIKYKEQLKQIKSLKFQVEELDEEKRVFEAFVIGMPR